MEDVDETARVTFGNEGCPEFQHSTAIRENIKDFEKHNESFLVEGEKDELDLLPPLLKINETKGCNNAFDSTSNSTEEPAQIESYRSDKSDRSDKSYRSDKSDRSDNVTVSSTGQNLEENEKVNQVAEQIEQKKPNHVVIDPELAKKVANLKPPVLSVNLFGTRYSAVKRVAKKLKYKSARKNGLWSLGWQDCGGLGMHEISQLKPLQKINHFPGMSQICQKCKLARTLNRMQLAFPKEYNFHPKTWCLPGDMEKLKYFSKTSRKNKFYIVKPDGGCQGNGIFVTNDVNQLPQDRDAAYAVQEYIKNPYTINGLKFDLRIYVLVTSCDPFLRAFIHREGLVRFATQKYKAPNANNLNDQYVHLTNYSINKHNQEYTVGSETSEANKNVEAKSIIKETEKDSKNVESETDKTDESSTIINETVKDTKSVETNLNDEEEEEKILFNTEGSKWSLSALFKYLDMQGHDSDKLWNKMKEVVVKTLLSIQKNLSHEYKACFGKSKEEGGFACFELLGFDIMLDSSLKPWLIEVNYSPSLHTDSKLDKIIKDNVILESLVLGSIGAEDLQSGCTATKAPSYAKQKRQMMELLSKRTTDRKILSKEQESSADDEQLKSVQVLRNIYEETHLKGFERVLPVTVDLGNGKNSFDSLDDEEKKYAEQLKARYAPIGKYKPPLFKENPATSNRRAAVEAERRKREAKRYTENRLVGHRPIWGSTGKVKAFQRCEQQRIDEGAILTRPKEEKPRRNTVPGSVQLSRSLRLMSGKSAKHMKSTYSGDREYKSKRKPPPIHRYYVQYQNTQNNIATETRSSVATQNLNLNLHSELERVKSVQFNFTGLSHGNDVKKDIYDRIPRRSRPGIRPISWTFNT